MEQVACTFCKFVTWCSAYCGHQVCGSAACLNRARDAERQNPPDQAAKLAP